MSVCLFSSFSCKAVCFFFLCQAVACARLSKCRHARSLGFVGIGSGSARSAPRRGDSGHARRLLSGSSPASPMFPTLPRRRLGKLGPSKQFELTSHRRDRDARAPGHRTGCAQKPRSRCPLNTKAPDRVGSGTGLSFGRDGAKGAHPSGTGLFSGPSGCTTWDAPHTRYAPLSMNLQTRTEICYCSTRNSNS